jgi:hypothetical protein
MISNEEIRFSINGVMLPHAKRFYLINYKKIPVFTRCNHLFLTTVGSYNRYLDSRDLFQKRQVERNSKQNMQTAKFQYLLIKNIVPYVNCLSFPSQYS